MGQLLSLLGGRRPPPPLTSMAVVEALAAVACDPGARTTEGMMLRNLLTEAAAVGRPLFSLFSHPAGERSIANFLTNPSLTTGYHAYQCRAAAGSKIFLSAAASCRVLEQLLRQECKRFPLPCLL
jgi:hypothetical protein